MKTVIKILAISLALLSSTYIFAAQRIPLGMICRGFYIEGDIGYGNQHFDKGRSSTNVFLTDVITSVNTVENNDGPAGRILVGYNFNSYLGLELGADGFRDLNWDIITQFQSGLRANVHMRTETYAIDLLGKLAYPICSNLIIYGKGGAAYVNSQNKFSNGAHSSQDFYRPELSAGFYIPLCPHLALDTNYLHIFRKGDLHKEDHTPALDAVLVGLAYQF